MYYNLEHNKPLKHKTYSKTLPIWINQFLKLTHYTCISSVLNIMYVSIIHIKAIMLTNFDEIYTFTFTFTFTIVSGKMH